MATHTSILAWEIPWTKEPGKLPSMGSQRVRHDFTFTYFLEGKLFHRARRPWTEQRQGLLGRTSVQKGLSLILLDLVSLSVAICNGPGIWRACL